MPSGCTFEPIDEIQIQGNENKNLQNFWSFIAYIKVILTSSNRIDDISYDVSNSRAVLKDNQFCLLCFSIFWYSYLLL